MEAVLILFGFLYGATLGSFYNVVGLRIPKKESIVNPPSHCTTCNRRLTLIDLVPIFSYIFLRGKCRTCHSKISPIYMTTEIATGVLFAFAVWKVGLTTELGVALLLISLLAIITVSDIAYMVISDKVLLFFLPCLIVARVFSPLDPWWSSVLGAVFGFGFLLLIAIFSNGGMGGGDIKLFFLIGWVLGFVHTAMALILSAVIGLVLGVIILSINKKERKTPIPFGPSIAIATILVYFYGDIMLNWYKSLF